MRSALFPLALSVLISACAGLPPEERPSSIFDVQLSPECCEDMALTPRSEGITPGEAAGAAALAAVEQPATPQKRRTVNQSGRLPKPAAEVDKPPVKESQGATEEGGKPTDKLVLDYEQADLRVVVDELADILGINLLVSAPITGAVTFRTDPENNLVRRDIWPLFRLLLANAGLNLVRRDDFYEVVQSSGDVLSDIALQGVDRQSQSPLVTQITPLRFVDATNAIELLTPILEGNGRITAANNINMLAITASQYRLEKINSLLGLVDIDPFQHRGIRLFYLQNSDVEQVAEELQGILAMIEGERGTYQVQGLKRINALLVVSPPLRGFKEVERWVGILDETGSSQREQMFVYKVKSLNAVSLAKTLTEVFKQENRVVLPTVAETQSSTRRPSLSRQTSSRVPGLSNEAQKPADTQSRSVVSPPPPPAVAEIQPQRTITSEGVSANLNLVIVADEDTNSLLVRATPRDYRQLLATVSLLDQPPMEAVISVIIAQVTLNDNSTFGIDWKYVWDNAGSFIGTGFGVLSGLSTTDGSAVGLVINSADGDLTAVLNALASTNKVDVLSRPTILVKNNQEASIKVGSQQPVITAQKQTENAGLAPVISNDISYRDTGIELTVKPQINDEGIIHLEIDQALSSIGQNSAVAGFPSFDNQQIKTVAVVADRSVIMIGGLIESVTINQEEYVPILGEIPVIGAAFGTTSVSTVRRELVLMIVPEIVDPTGGEAFYKAFRKRVQYAATVLESSFTEDPMRRKTMQEKIERVLIPNR